jgi:uncharacterized protein (TIGR03084 family)
MQQAYDFKDESDALCAILAPLVEAEFAMPTLFKSWTIDDILQHLHYFNIMADLSLNDPEKFAVDYAVLTRYRQSGMGFVEVTDRLLDGLKGPRLLEAWKQTYEEMTPRFAAADPKQRVKWAGPDMSVRSSITARQMETWAHGQAIFDLLGLERADTDRVRNIAHLGVNTFGWTFRNRGEAIPEPAPHVVLAAPSGTSWEWGEPDSPERVEGSATQFCQVVCQTRNVEDTSIRTKGRVAERWMSVAQCFAGPPHDPPPPGTRRKA